MEEKHPAFDPACDISGDNEPAAPPSQFIDFAAGFPADYGVVVDFSAMPEPVACSGTLVVEQTASGAVVTTSGF